MFRIMLVCEYISVLVRRWLVECVVEDVGLKEVFKYYDVGCSNYDCR